MPRHLDDGPAETADEPNDPVKALSSKKHQAVWLHDGVRARVDDALPSSLEVADDVPALVPVRRVRERIDDEDTSARDEL